MTTLVKNGYGRDDADKIESVCAAAEAGVDHGKPRTELV
jgi:hypothetical protein